MADGAHSSQASGWRTSKACQECRKRKIKCNGIDPCKTCQLRNTPCIYRDWIRHRRKKYSEQKEFMPNGPTRPDHSARQPSPGFGQPSSSTGRRNGSSNYTFNHSVSATDTTSSSSKVQLYYGSTSHFALMHEIYRDLVTYPTNTSKEPQAEVEEAGAGLDMFSFRRIFFGTPLEPHDALKSLNATDVPVMFLPYDLAEVFLQRFLATLYYLIPFRPRETYRRQLDHLYNPTPGLHSDTWTHCMLLMALALGSLGTEHYGWGDVLFERVKSACALSDDVVNLQTHAHFQTEQGRPNSSFLHLGAAARKALSAGLHKEAPHQAQEDGDSIQERRDYRSYDSKIQEALGFGLSKCPQPGEIGVQQTIMVTLYYHTILLTFRPFLIFRGRWQQDMKMSSHEFGNSGTKRPTEIPTWLNEACNQALGAACRTIQYIHEASMVNDLVTELRYHGYFLGSSSFTLIYDLMHGENLAPTHLPWIHTAIQCLSSMRAGDPINSSIGAIQTVLRKLNPSYEWVPPSIVKNDAYGYGQGPAPMRQGPINATKNVETTIPETLPTEYAVGGAGLPTWSDMQGGLLAGDMPPASASIGSGEDLLDLTLADMGWDFDFSTMDLEAFFSVYPNMETPPFG
ncbi:hypothetical protein FE257_005877 [Aspergillus nanangensis]|uniref:Zn(2)-C6 fungal-type domain-containing protein n=1 Tax=Aspergillus nanangensis TaxID=2582783 RepID=A0AAD4GV58_ASPNN|nr:hypothetical protein FE257_005877 [Aspergillus nanangensis]